MNVDNPIKHPLRGSLMNPEGAETGAGRGRGVGW